MSGWGNLLVGCRTSASGPPVRTRTSAGQSACTRTPLAAYLGTCAQTRYPYPCPYRVGTGWGAATPRRENHHARSRGVPHYHHDAQEMPQVLLLVRPRPLQHRWRGGCPCQPPPDSLLTPEAPRPAWAMPRVQHARPPWLVTRDGGAGWETFPGNGPASPQLAMKSQYNCPQFAPPICPK